MYYEPDNRPELGPRLVPALSISLRQHVFPDVQLDVEDHVLTLCLAIACAYPQDPGEEPTDPELPDPESPQDPELPEQELQEEDIDEDFEPG